LIGEDKIIKTLNVFEDYITTYIKTVLMNRI